MDTLNRFFLGIYPYIRPIISFLGNLMRFDREQYTWKSDSSEPFYCGQLRLGSVLFHVGVLAVLFDRLFGLLTPPWFRKFISISHQAKQVTAMMAGGIFGSAAPAGLIILIRRCFKIERISVNSIQRDKLVLVWLLITLLLELSTIFVSMGHLSDGEMVKLIQWAQRIVTLRDGAVPYLEDVSFLFKMYIFMDTTFFFIFPFTRVAHTWSGFASVFCTDRAWQLARRR